MGEACGLGTDIVEIDRIAKIARRNPRFLKRVFSPAELKYCLSKKKRWQHLAVRFAAKEAVWKALGPRQDGLGLMDISVTRGPKGEPGVSIKGRRAPEMRLSLSHSEHYAMAVALRLSRGRP